jgi:cytochrome c oxidase subunit 2
MRTKTGKPNFDYALLCNKICGSAHYRMKMVIIVDTKADYEKWLKSQKTLAQSTPVVSENTVALK